MSKPKKTAAKPETEPCWYCQRADAVLWCDFMLGGVHGPPEQIPLPVDAAPWPLILGAPFMTRSDLGRMHFDIRTSSPIATCDAAACRTCAEKFGWRHVTHFGNETVDHCHHHAAQEAAFGRSLFIGAAAAEALRAEVRVKCARTAFTVVSAQHENGGAT